MHQQWVGCAQVRCDKVLAERVAADPLMQQPPNVIQKHAMTVFANIGNKFMRLFCEQKWVHFFCDYDFGILIKYFLFKSIQTSNGTTSHDDVIGVVSHLDHMVTLLLLELHNCNKYPPPVAQTAPPSPCLEYLLSENLLDKLYEWSKTTER